MTMKNRHDFILLMDVKNGNPNGDPDLNGQPRQCPITSKGLITDVCIKRKIRNSILTRHLGEASRNILIQEGVILNDLISAPYETDEEVKKAFEALKNKEKGADPVALAKIALQKDYYDVRAFGAVMSTGDSEEGEGSKEDSKETKKKKYKKNAGVVRGPVQVTWAESFHPIFIGTETITRSCVTNKEDENKERTMGTKYRVPYALYKCHVYISASDAAKTGFSDEDLALLKESIINMFEDDRSSSRGEMILRKFVDFKHESKYGNAPAHKLFERLKVELNNGVDVPTSYQDYTVTLDESNFPSGVSVENIV